MEKAVSEVEESEMKHSKLALLLKDLLDHIDSARNTLHARFLELQEHDNRIGVVGNQLEAKGRELNGIDELIAAKGIELNGVEKLIGEKLKEVESGKEHLRSVQLLIQEHEEELDVKEREFSDVQRLVGEKKRECDLLEERIKDQTTRFEDFEEKISLGEKRFLDVQRSVEEKENECDLIEKRFQNRTQRLNWLERTVEEKSKLIGFREKEVKDVRGQLEKFSKLIESRERQLDEIVGSIQEHKIEFDLKTKQMETVQRSVDECDKEMKLKEKKLSSIQKSMEECSKTVESKRKIIRGMDEKVKEFSMHKKSMKKWSCKLELKEKQFESKVEDLNKRMNECLKEIHAKEKHFDSLLITECEEHLDSLEKSLEECSNGLKTKEKQLEQRAIELELKQQQLDSVQKSTEERNQNLELIPANIAPVPSSTSNQSSKTRDGRGLQALMNDHLKRIDSLGSEMSAYLKASTDPAELVLDAMQDFYPSNSPVDSMKFDFDLTVIRRSCVLLLQELKRLSPQINPQVKEEAIKLAADWKAKMRVAAEHSLESLGFLWLLASFELVSTYNAKELQSLLAIVGVQEHGAELCQALGISDQEPGSTLYFPIKIEEQNSPIRNVSTSSAPNLQLCATTDARNLRGSPNEHLSGDHLLLNEICDALRLSVDPAKFALTMMQKSLSEDLSKGDVGREATFWMKNLSMLKELSKVLVHVGPHVKKDATELAVQWKQKMRANSDRSLEVVCFMQFIATYGLLSTFNIDEIVKLLGVISQHKQAPELLQTPGFADKIPDFVRNLIEKKQLIEAIRFICNFKLIDKFPTILLLKACVEDARVSYSTICRENKSLDEMDKFIDDKIADLRAVRQYIRDYNLEYPSKDIEIYIFKLEKQKETWRHLLGSYAIEQDRQKRKNSSTITSAPMFQPPEKRQAIAAARSYALQSFTQGYPQLTSPQLHGNYGHHRQFGMGSNDREFGPNIGANSSSWLYKNLRHPVQFGDVANHSGIGGNFGPMPLSSSSQLFENQGHPAQFGVAAYSEIGGNFGAMPSMSSSSQLIYGHSVAASNLEIGADFSTLQNATLHHSDPFLPAPHSYGPN